MNFSSFNEVVTYLDSFSYKDKSKAPGTLRGYRLERMHALLRHLGNPERRYKTIHLAGSKGKGSTASFIASALSANGEITGLYLSPHLVDYRERFTLAGVFFPDEDLICVAEELSQKLEDFHYDGDYGYASPSTFELYTAYAYMLFAHAGCTWAVIETGLGGRLDATNTIDSVAEVLLPIELEHTAILGSTIPLIATEKAKIIKKNSIALISYQRPEARSVFEKECEEVGAEAFFLDKEVKTLETHTTIAGEIVHIVFSSGKEEHLCLAMRGEVQAQNAALALLTSMKLGFYREGVTEKAIENTTLPGRFEIQKYQGKTLVFDVAHTKESMMHTINSFAALFPQREKNCCIYASIEGKDSTHMLTSILSVFDTVVISRPGTFKKSDIGALYAEACSIAPQTTIILEEDAKSALLTGLSHTASDGTLLITGSFYLASDIKGAL